VVFLYQAERAFSAGGAMVLLAGGERILTGSTSNIGAREWSVADGRLKTVHFSEQCEAGAHTAVAADASGARVFVGDSDGGLWLWRLSPEYGLDAALMIDDAGGVADLAVTPDGAELFALGAGSGVLMAIDPSACEQVGTFATGSESVRSMTLTPDGTILVAGGAEGSLSFWDRASKELQVRVVGHDGPVVSLASSLDGRYAVSADGDGVIKRWDLDPLAADAGLTIVSRP
jgi:WD40 repeat protein